MTTQFNQNHNGDEVSIKILGLIERSGLLYPHGLIEYDGGVHKFDCTPQNNLITTGVQLSDKIILVIFHSGLTKWYPFTLENMESIVWDFHNIEDIQIIEKGE